MRDGGGLNVARAVCDGSSVPGVPLVRTEGKDFAEGYPTLGPAEFAASTPLRVESRSDNTRAVEAAFGLGSCLYFYAGRAHPDFGDAVLVYDSEWADTENGGATPFDTGGFFLDKICVDGVGGDEKKAYVDAQSCGLSEWRTRFNEYLAAHFASAASYVRGERPINDDPRHRLRDAKDCRAWTWEIRVHRDHDLLDGLRNVYLGFDYATGVRRHLRAMNPAVGAAWQQRFMSGMVKEADPTDAGDWPHAMAHQEIIACL